MKSAKILTLYCLIALPLAQGAAGAKEFLYVPKPSTGGQGASPAKKVLVRRVTVKRGDTLKKLSKEHIGDASSFPQVLRLNNVKNPDLLQPGETLLIPVSRSHHASTKKAAKATRGTKGKRRYAHHRPYLSGKALPEQVKSTVPAPATDEQASYRRVQRAYQAGDYQTSLELYDDFLRRFPHSELAAEASLNQANCYLGLSGQ